MPRSMLSRDSFNKAQGHRLKHLLPPLLAPRLLSLFLSMVVLLKHLFDLLPRCRHLDLLLLLWLLLQLFNGNNNNNNNWSTNLCCNLNLQRSQLRWPPSPLWLGGSLICASMLQDLLRDLQCRLLLATKTRHLILNRLLYLKCRLLALLFSPPSLVPLSRPMLLGLL